MYIVASCTHAQVTKMSTVEYASFLMGLALGGILGFSGIAIFITRLDLWGDR